MGQYYKQAVRCTESVPLTLTFELWYTILYALMMKKTGKWNSNSNLNVHRWEMEMCTNEKSSHLKSISAERCPWLHLNCISSLQNFSSLSNFFFHIFRIIVKCCNDQFQNLLELFHPSGPRSTYLAAFQRESLPWQSLSVFSSKLGFQIHVSGWSVLV